jgi:hypothetical protein
MGFFDDLGSGDDKPEPEQQTRHPGRIGPPAGWVLPTVLPTVRELGRSHNARVALTGLRCWPDGVDLSLTLMCRWLRPGTGPGAHDWNCRFGVQFSDGRRVLAPTRTGAAPTPGPDDLVLERRGGGGSRFHRVMDFYLWPLPPKGRLTLVVDWSSQGVPETRTELDAGDLRSAAARAVVVWSDLAMGDRWIEAGESLGNRGLR